MSNSSAEISQQIHANIPVPTYRLMCSQCGWLLTIAGLGDSRAVLDTGAEIVQLSVDHRVATHRQERHRLEGTGALVAPIDVSGAHRVCTACIALQAWILCLLILQV